MRIQEAELLAARARAIGFVSRAHVTRVAGVAGGWGIRVWTDVDGDKQEEKRTFTSAEDFDAFVKREDAASPAGDEAEAAIREEAAEILEEIETPEEPVEQEKGKAEKGAKGTKSGKNGRK